MDAAPCQNCHVCGAEGNLLYENLPDRLFSVSGQWDLRKCKNAECGSLWMDPMPLESELHKAYKSYYTHGDGDPRSGVSKRQVLARRVVRWLNHVRRLGRLGYEAPGQIRDPRRVLHELRLHKTPAEVDIMRRAGAVTREAHKECMRACKPGLNERQLVAVLDFTYRKHGRRCSGARPPASTSSSASCCPRAMSRASIDVSASS